MQKIFFKFNFIRRKERNTLKLETVRALINESEFVKNEECNEMFQPDRDVRNN